MLTPDIEKMHLQVLVHPEFGNINRYFGNTTTKSAPFSIQVVAFEEGPSSYLAILGVRKLDEDEGTDLQIGAKTVEEDLYVDNL